MSQGQSNPYPLRIDKELMDKVKELQPHIWRVMMGEEKPQNCGKCEYCRYSINNPDFILPTQIEV